MLWATKQARNTDNSSMAPTRPASSPLQTPPAAARRKEKVLQALSKLNDRDTQRAASEELALILHVRGEQMHDLALCRDTPSGFLCNALMSQSKQHSHEKSQRIYQVVGYSSPSHKS